MCPKCGNKRITGKICGRCGHDFLPHVMSSSQRKAAITDLFKKMEPTFGMLYGRWQDEKEYEDFADYIKVAQNALKENCPTAIFKKFSKRPFAMTFSAFGCSEIVFSCTATEYKWKTIFPADEPLKITPIPHVPTKLYMAYNHNDVALMKAPTDKKKAEREAKVYREATGNAAYVAEYEEVIPITAIEVPKAAKGAKESLREMLLAAREKGCTEQNLCTALGIDKKRLSDYICYLKNPKYAGTKGAMKIAKRGDHYYAD